jgi:hypothetical protein
MNNRAKRFLGVSAYAIAMAYLEAVVVVYLRALLGLTDITDVDVSLGPYGLVEIGREAATMVMLAAVGWWLAATGRSDGPMGCLRLDSGMFSTIYGFAFFYLGPSPCWGGICCS